MNKYVKYVILFIVLGFLMLWGHSQYSPQKKSEKLTYHEEVKTRDGAMILGGASKDKEKIEQFAENLKGDAQYRAFWDNLHISSDYKMKGDFKNAILYTKKALENSPSKVDTFQAKMGLAQLYEETKQYELAIKEYKWCIDYSNRPDVIEKLKNKIEELKESMESLKK